jgi:hypothetical protein
MMTSLGFREVAPPMLQPHLATPTLSPQRHLGDNGTESAEASQVLKIISGEIESP